MGNARQPNIRTASVTPLRLSRRAVGLVLLNPFRLPELLAKNVQASPRCCSAAGSRTLAALAAHIANRNRIFKSLNDSGGSRVGVFWFIQKPNHTPELLADCVPL